MTDITKCDGTGCPEKEVCYRHTSPVQKWQSMFCVVPWDAEKGECRYFWDATVFDDGDEEGFGL